MTVRITTDGKRILADIPFDHGQGPIRAKRIPGWKPHIVADQFRGWAYPLTMDTCRTFRRVFGQQLHVDPPLVRWAHDAVAREGAMERARNGQAIRLTGLQEQAPDLYTAVRTRQYQAVGTSFLLAAGAALLGDDPGLGKTLQALAALTEKGSKDILVACPRTTATSVWADETSYWAPHIHTYVVQGGRTQREKVFAQYLADDSGAPRMAIVNIEMMRVLRRYQCKVDVPSEEPKEKPDWAPASLVWCQEHKGWESKYRPSENKGCHGNHDHVTRRHPEWRFLHDTMWDAIVIDEAHGPLATTKGVMSKGISQVRYGAVLLRRNLRTGGLAIAMSGTPFRSKLERSWGTLNWLRPDVFSSYWQFAETHFDVEDNMVGTWDPESERHIAIPKDPEAFNAALAPYYIARDKNIAAPDLPPVRFAGVPLPGKPRNGPRYIRIDMEDKQAKAYEDMRLMAEAEIEDGHLTAIGVLAEITRLRQFALGYAKLDEDGVVHPILPSNKAEWILQWLWENQDREGKVVIASMFTRFIKFLENLVRGEGHEVLTLTGETSDRGRAQMIKRFQNPHDPCRIAIINMQAGGVGITLDRADDMILTDLPWTSDNEKQVIDRIHRVSRRHNVMVHRLLSRDTVDIWLAGLTESQRQVLASVRSGADRKVPQFFAGAVA